jgi:hypothetical protein
MKTFIKFASQILWGCEINVLEICGTGKAYGIMKILNTLEEESKWKRKFLISSRNEVRDRVVTAFYPICSVILTAKP